MPRQCGHALGSTRWCPDCELAEMQAHRKPIDPNHDIVPSLRMFDGLLMGMAADEIERLREALRDSATRPCEQLLLVGPGWNEVHKVIAPPIVADGMLQVHIDTRKPDPLPPVGGDKLPPIGAKVLIHLARADAWVEHEVAGYYVWGNHGPEKWLYRVFIQVRDAQGYLNARMLNEIRYPTGLPAGA